jgi:hypothetical protein
MKKTILIWLLGLLCIIGVEQISLEGGLVGREIAGVARGKRALRKRLEALQRVFGIRSFELEKAKVLEEGKLLEEISKSRINTYRDFKLGQLLSSNLN